LAIVAAMLRRASARAKAEPMLPAPMMPMLMMCSIYSLPY
jgi:hypothetical protein